MKTNNILFIITAFLFSLLSFGFICDIAAIDVAVGNINVLPIALAVGGTALSYAPLIPGGVSLFAYVKVSVPKEGANPGRPSQKDPNIILFDWDDVPENPSRDDKGIKITEDLQLDAGANAIEIYATPTSINYNDEGTGDPDAKGFIQNLTFEHPGDGLVLSEFKENNINTNLGAIVKNCAGGDKRLLGTKCVPLQFEVSGQNNNEANKNTFTLKSILVGPAMAHYEGADPALDTDSGSGSGA